MIKTQDAICITCIPRVSLISERVNWLRGRDRRRSFSSIQVGERRLPRLIDKCHESRVKFVYFKDKLGMMQNVSLVEREC
jgi:hypothetical protein